LPPGLVPPMMMNHGIPTAQSPQPLSSSSSSSSGLPTPKIDFSSFQRQPFAAVNTNFAMPPAFIPSNNNFGFP
jgi:hypothetical protein